MRKLFMPILLLIASVCGAQQIQDINLFGLEQRTGTPRFQAMAGAFGALGGDFSALAINPAGAAVFKHNQLGFSLSQHITENQTSFGNQNSFNDTRQLGFNQAGIVFVYENRNNSPWKRLSLALNSDNSNFYKGAISANGIAANGLDQFFLDNAEGIPFGDLLKLDNELLEEAYLNIGSEIGFTAQQAFLGYYAGVLDPSEMDNNNISSYVSNALYKQVEQSHNIRTKGKNSKFISTLAAQYMDFLYLGAGLEFQNLLYEKQTRIQENGYETSSPLQYLNFNNFIETSGNALALNVGAITKIGNSLRLGLSYKTPTWYTLSDKTHQQIESNLEDVDIKFIDKNQINIFEDYQITIPSKITASAAVVLGKRGLISVDYSQQDFSKARFRPLADSFFTTLNQSAVRQLTRVNTLNIGGEYNLGRLSLRMGYGSNNSPFQTNDSFSENQALGFGWIFGGGKIDFSFSQWSTSNSHTTLNYTGAPEMTLKTIRNTATIGYTLFF